MSKDVLKLAGMTIVLVVLLLVAVAAGVLIGKWLDHPGSVSGIPVLEAIHHVNKQTFIEHYLVVDVDYTDAPEVWPKLLEKLGIKQEFVVLIRGRVPAGFDLQKLSEKDIWTSSDGKHVQLTLPAPMVFEENVSIDFENSRVLSSRDTCPNWLCEDEVAVFLREVLPSARDILIEYAIRHEILKQAAQDGKAYYEQFLTSLGFEQVDVIVAGYGF